MTKPSFAIHGLLLLCLSAPLFAVSQDLSPENRAQFVKEQDAYLESLHLSIDQRKAYQLITIKYEKLYQALARSEASGSTKKSKAKKIQKAKNADMKALLSSIQYKRYLKRQKEIDKNYQ